MPLGANGQTLTSKRLGKVYLTQSGGTFIQTLQSSVPSAPGLMGPAFLDHVYKAIHMDNILAVPGTESL
jgi:hypothetical protein